VSAFTHAELKALAAELGRPVSTLYALAPANDPFYIGPARAADAEWFAAEWHRLAIPGGWHYRRIHYVFVSQAVLILMLDGTPYENTLECWAVLCNAARDAVALDLVPQNAFSDHRNAAPIEYLVEPDDASVNVVNPSPGFLIPRVPAVPQLEFVPPTVPQPFHIEVWCEKSTINDVLDPLARRYRFNLITGIGELSATRCREVVDRAENSGRPVRILYISDFDPAGASMPVAVARKIEFEIDKRGVKLDVQLRPIVLTHQQTIDFKLPRTPIKQTERRASRFEARFGEGATELDALEALHPGALRDIVRREADRYWNPSHDNDVDDSCRSFVELCREETQAVLAAHQDRLEELNTEWQRVAADLRAWQDRAAPVWRGIAESLEKCAPEVGNGYDFTPPFEADEDPDPLYDSRRSYVEQVDRYKAHQGKPVARKARSNGA
jgi:hypothetical protein